MTPLSWPLNLFGLWEAWLRPWLQPEPALMPITPLGSEHAGALADIHAAAFGRAWGSFEFERLLADRNVVADGIFLPRARDPFGFALSRRVLDEAEILTIAIRPDCRGRGHARPLLQHHLDELARAGVRTVHLEVEEGNAPALALYRRLRFETVGRRAGYYAKPDGSKAAALTMSLKL
ncbi:MAG TPA: GNAT family N-acetyltransferase [Microvirga sp.]|jgi:ribosomal-protein-alanine N-acetyltransferase|nr:GNAT family N-acetyltransferase [Microvirga sp.]